MFLLVTPYTGSWSPEAPGPCARASHAGSGVALLLELSRALSEHPLPYETWFAFVDEGPEATEPARPPAGSLSLAHALAESGKLERIRLAVFVAGVGEANLRVPRDLSSNRMFRERFFRVAARLGHEDIFAPEGNYASLRTGHRAFEQVGQGGVVAIVGSVPASDEDGSLREEAAETLDPDPEQACSSQTLRAVGEVNLGALDELAALLQRLDCIGSSRRAAAPPETSAAPGNE